VLCLLFFSATSTEVPLLSSGGAGRRLPDKSRTVFDLSEVKIIVQQVHHNGIVDLGFHQEGIGNTPRDDNDKKCGNKYREYKDGCSAVPFDHDIYLSVLFDVANLKKKNENVKWFLC
jgi:hypothetical protein